jgi:hypothetical protein
MIEVAGFVLVATRPCGPVLPPGQPGKSHPRSLEQQAGGDDIGTP